MRPRGLRASDTCWPGKSAMQGQQGEACPQHNNSGPACHKRWTAQRPTPHSAATGDSHCFKHKFRSEAHPQDDSVRAGTCPCCSKAHCCHSTAECPDVTHDCSAHRSRSTEPPTQGSCCFRPAVGCQTMHCCCAYPLLGLRWAARRRCCHLTCCWLPAGAHNPCETHVEAADLVHRPPPPHVWRKCSPSGYWWGCQRRCPPA